MFVLYHPKIKIDFSFETCLWSLTLAEIKFKVEILSKESWNTRTVILLQKQAKCDNKYCYKKLLRFTVNFLFMTGMKVGHQKFPLTVAPCRTLRGGLKKSQIDAV